jgi:phenylacetate-coenzyme A ligase PaaK-like adenylate-forming protein
VAQMRLFGAKVPYPTYLDPDDFSPVARYLVERHAQGTKTAIVGFVSSIARVAAAAVDLCLDLNGCLALVVGEALTDAKRRVIESAGIDVYPTYGTSDFGNIGYPCRKMKTGNCVHVFQHAAGLISRQQTSTYTDHTADVLYATSLLPFAPRLFINVELGDSGTIEPTSCDCGFSRLGLNVQVRDMAAISKVTAQGMTVGADELVQVLEEALPAKFGGRPGDYQIVETEAASQTEVILRIRPGVTSAPPEQVLQVFLDEARRLYGGSLSVLSWVHSNGIRAEFAAPILAGTGKFRAIRLLGSGVANQPPPESESQKRV